jgi:hypothetical protein
VAGNLTQVTPLRLRYLEAVLAAYAAAYGAPMPVDVWGMHAFVLPEVRDDWGAGVPPGIPVAAEEGMRWTLADHDDPALVLAQVRQMRTWMAAHGYESTPLWITEYGVLMPAEYGFSPARVAAFLVATFDEFRTACDPELGLPSDDYRLVQRWLWFSAHAADYPTGDLFGAGGQPTGLMGVLATYLATHPMDTVVPCP